VANRPFSWANSLKEPKRSYRFSVNFPYFSPTTHAQEHVFGGRAYLLAKHLSKAGTVRCGKHLNYNETNFAITDLSKAEYSYELEADVVHGVTINSARIKGEEKFTPMSMKLIVSKGADLEWSMNFLTYFRGPGKAYHDTWGLSAGAQSAEATPTVPTTNPCKGKLGSELRKCRKSAPYSGYKEKNSSRTNSSLTLRGDNFRPIPQLIVYEWAGGTLANPSGQEATYSWEPNRGGAYKYFSAPWIARYIIKNPVITSWKISPYSYSSDDFVTLEILVRPGAAGYVDYEVNGPGNTNDVKHKINEDKPEIAASYASYSNRIVRNSIGDVRKFIAQDKQLPDSGREKRGIAMGKGPGQGPAWTAIHGSADKDPPVLAEASAEYQAGVTSLTREARAVEEQEQRKARKAAEMNQAQATADAKRVEASKARADAMRAGEDQKKADNAELDRKNSPEWQSAQDEFQKGQDAQTEARRRQGMSAESLAGPSAPAEAPSGDLFDSLSNTGQRRVDQPGGPPGPESRGAQWSGQITPEQRAQIRREAAQDRARRENASRMEALAEARRRDREARNNETP